MTDRHKMGGGIRYYDPSGAFNGYTLFSEMGNNNVWLIDMWGTIVHRWKISRCIRGIYSVLLPDGKLLYAGKTGKENLPEFGGTFTVLLELDWAGNILRELDSKAYGQDFSHDFFRMKNGHTMILQWIETPPDITAKVKWGAPGTEREGVMWSDALLEIDPQGEVVWRWISYEHMDVEKDIICPINPRDRWLQGNGIHVMPDGNVLITSPWCDEVIMVERETGKIKWRWGGRKVLGFPHNPSMLDNGNVLLFDNGRYRPQPPDYSRVIEINPETNQVEWEYMAEPPHSFYASFMGGAQRLPNGNTLICESAHGRFFEIDPSKRIVWEYVNPFFYETARFGWATRFGRTNMTFRAYRYHPDYPGLRGTGLDDINRVYGPQRLGAFDPRPTGAPLQGISETSEGLSMPSLGAKSGTPQGDEQEVQSRLKYLGY